MRTSYEDRFWIQTACTVIFSLAICAELLNLIVLYENPWGYVQSLPVISFIATLGWGLVGIAFTACIVELLISVERVYHPEDEVPPSMMDVAIRTLWSLMGVAISLVVVYLALRFQYVYFEGELAAHGAGLGIQMTFNALAIEGCILPGILLVAICSIRMNYLQQEHKKLVGRRTTRAMHAEA